MLTLEKYKEQLRELGIKEGDSVLVHSSFKSLGEVDGGAQTVIDGLLQVIGEEGTLIFPTLCQKDWEHVYENWHMDAPSDVGYLTEYFRKLPDAIRSNQATHSVAAIGKLAKYITETHGQSGLRFGSFGDTPFSADSPWQKMYDLDTKIMFIGVKIRCCTHRHLAEYMFINDEINKVKGTDKYEEYKNRVSAYGKPGAWVSVPLEQIHDIIDGEGIIHSGKCGEAEVYWMSCKEYMECMLKFMREFDPRFYASKKAEDLKEIIEEIEAQKRG